MTLPDLHPQCIRYTATIHCKDRDGQFVGTYVTDSSGLKSSTFTEGYLITPGFSLDLIPEVELVHLEGYGAWRLTNFGHPSHDCWAVTLRRPAIACETNLGGVIGQLTPLAQELGRARTKFPANQYLFEALAEEIGEMGDAFLLYGDCEKSRCEALQVACVAMRIYLEGVNRVGEDPRTLAALAALEGPARVFFASIKNRPDLSARSDESPS